MNTEQKILLACFAVYSAFTFVGVLRASRQPTLAPIPLDQSEAVENYVFGSEFRGTWVNKAGSTEFLSSSNGMARLSFYRIQSLNFDDQLELKLDTLIYVFISLFDPQFRDEKYLRVIQAVVFDSPANVTLRRPDDTARVASRVIWQENMNDLTEVRNASFSGNVTFAPEIIANNSLLPSVFQESEKLLKVALKEEGGGGLDLVLHLHVSRENQARTSLLYAYFMVVIAMVNFLGAQNLLRSIHDNYSFTKRLSMATVTLVCLQDCLIFLINIQLGINFLDAWSFVLVISWYFVLFCFVDYRILLYVWRYRNHREFDDLTEQQFRNKLYCFQMRIYLSIIVYLVLMWHFFLNVYLVLANALVLVPQIVHHIQSAEPPTFNKSLLILFSSVKYLVFAYFRGCPHNILQVRYFYFLPMAGAALLLLSLLLLSQQENYGSQYFLPKIFKTHSFDYWIEMAELPKPAGKEGEKLNETQDEATCCICLCALAAQTPHGATASESQLKSKILSRILRARGQKYLMRTPCGHVFHADCLISWMDVKMECPHCRQTLPQII